MSMELLYICDLKDERLDFIYTSSQLLPGLVAGALVRYVLCGVGITEVQFMFHICHCCDVYHIMLHLTVSL